jgi:hypothetical protein
MSNITNLEQSKLIALLPAVTAKMKSPALQRRSRLLPFAMLHAARGIMLGDKWSTGDG